MNVKKRKNFSGKERGPFCFRQLLTRLDQFGEKSRGDLAQAIVEFTFSMVVVVLLMMAMTQLIVWSSQELVERRKAHEKTLTSWNPILKQTKPDFFFTTSMNTSVPSDIFGDRNL